MTSEVYDPSRNKVIIANHTLVGVTSIHVARGNDTFRVVEGISPLYAAIVRNYKRPFKLTVKLLQTSASNSVLQHLHTSSEVMFNSFCRVEVISQESKPNISSTGHIISAPNLILNPEADEREWVFVVNAFDFSGLTDLIM